MSWAERPDEGCPQPGLPHIAAKWSPISLAPCICGSSLTPFLLSNRLPCPPDVLVRKWDTRSPPPPSGTNQPSRQRCPGCARPCPCLLAGPSCCPPPHACPTMEATQRTCAGPPPALHASALAVHSAPAPPVGPSRHSQNLSSAASGRQSRSVSTVNTAVSPLRFNFLFFNILLLVFKHREVSVLPNHPVCLPSPLPGVFPLPLTSVEPSCSRCISKEGAGVGTTLHIPACLSPPGACLSSGVLLLREHFHAAKCIQLGCAACGLVATPARAQQAQNVALT